jgi:predicted PP-loop superfamily ATPase
MEKRTYKVHNRKNEEFARRMMTETHVPEWKIYKEVFCPDSQATLNCLRVKACQLKQQPRFKKYLDQVKEEIRERFMVTVESLEIELDEIKAVALSAQTPQCGAAVNAVMSKAKLYGLDKQKTTEEDAPQPVQVIIQVQDASIQRDG